MNSRSTSRIVLQCSGVSSDESTPGVVAVSGVEKVCWSFGAREEVATFIADVCGWLFFLPAFHVQAMGTLQPSQHTPMSFGRSPSGVLLFIGCVLFSQNLI